jgi:hypothetical protein
LAGFTVVSFNPSSRHAISTMLVMVVLMLL